MDVIIAFVLESTSPRIVGVFSADVSVEEIEEYCRFWQDKLEGTKHWTEAWSVQEVKDLTEIGCRIF